MGVRRDLPPAAVGPALDVVVHHRDDDVAEVGARDEPSEGLVGRAPAPSTGTAEDIAATLRSSGSDASSDLPGQCDAQRLGVWVHDGGRHTRDCSGAHRPAIPCASPAAEREESELSVQERLVAAGIVLPPPVRLPTAVKGSFVPARRTGNLVYLSGSGPLRDGHVVYGGKVGRDLTVEEGYQAARLTAINLVAALQREVGDLELVSRWIKVLGMVNSAPGFDQQPAVVNGFSDLIIELFGEEVGAHARSAVGVAELPSGIAVEVEAIVEVG